MPARVFKGTDPLKIEASGQNGALVVDKTARVVVVYET